MDQNLLLSSVVEMGLDLLEQHGSFIPFCKAVNAAGETFIYSPESRTGKGFTEAQASESVRSNLLRDIGPRGLIGAAFCFHSQIRFADSVEKVPAIEVELHFRDQHSAIWYFPYRMAGKTASVLEYFSNAISGNVFAEA